MTPRSVLGIALTLVLAQGCAAVQRWEFSRPTLERPESMAIDEKGYVGLPGVKVAVTARNDRATFALAGPAIVVPLPIIPLPGSVIDPPKREPPFWIDVAIDPEGEGFTFAPGEVRLHVDRRAGLTPTLTRGPAAVSEYLGRRDGQVLCGFDPSGDNGAIAPIPVRERTCFSLRFEIVPPTADTSFVVSLHGLAKDGQPVDPPQILFTKGRAWSFQCCL
ncbi:MAG: hypothetical protein DMD87_23160 [Candidatus Rokuibacteriota bacterium]|nr:MAG: hypothetical protein DMD87_23160 [Candidatus Rokubacteria bacterium]